jgi:hypothetical protein
LAGNPALKRRFLREARAASALNHAIIMGLCDISSHDDADFLMMDVESVMRLLLGPQSVRNCRRPEAVRILSIIDLS